MRNAVLDPADLILRALFIVLICVSLFEPLARLFEPKEIRTREIPDHYLLLWLIRLGFLRVGLGLCLGSLDRLQNREKNETRVKSWIITSSLVSGLLACRCSPVLAFLIGGSASGSVSEFANLRLVESALSNAIVRPAPCCRCIITLQK